MRSGVPHVSFEMYTALEPAEVRKRLDEYDDWSSGDSRAYIHGSYSSGNDSSKYDVSSSIIIVSAIVLFTLVVATILVRRGRRRMLQETKVLPYQSDPWDHAIEVPSQARVDPDPDGVPGGVSLFHLARAMAMMESMRSKEQRNR